MRLEVRQTKTDSAAMANAATTPPTSLNVESQEDLPPPPVRGNSLGMTNELGIERGVPGTGVL
jgi:hypothetical protein